MKHYLAVLIVVLLGCPSVSLSDKDAATVAAVYHAWDTSPDLPPSRGDCRNVDVVRHTSLRAYADACLGLRSNAWRKDVENSAGCTSTAFRGAAREKWYTVRLAPGYENDASLVVHEMLHVLMACTDAGRPGDPFDAGHRDVRVWQAAGGASSVQAEANALLRD